MKKELIGICSALTDNTSVAEKYAEHLSELFAVVMPDMIGEEFKLALCEERAADAVALLAKYYRAKPDPTVKELYSVGEYDLELCDKTSRGIMREVNVDWEFEGGEVDFLFDPTEIKRPINPEWLWQFNRHKYWSNMSRTYRATGDEKYAAAFKKQLLKWIAETYIPEVWNYPGSAWRTIECGIRLLGHWQVAFDGFRHSETVDDTTLLLMIASMHRQSTHLMAHPTKGNWLMMEMNGVYTFSGLFPELCDSEGNRSVAASRILAEIENQILPDGFQNELSPDYQAVVYNCAYNFYNLTVGLGLGDSLPEKFFDLMRRAADAMIKISTPAFTQPRTNDTYTIPTARFANQATAVLGDAPEYRFVTSRRAEGAPPKGETASHFLPYAGFAAMRSDWGADATYMCFDVGPLGCAHIHQDKLNINIYKGDEELIFDDGGGQYDLSEARKYAVSGYGHNTALVDGLAQYRCEPYKSETPIDAGFITNAEFDYAEGVYDGGFGDGSAKLATHKRAVRFVKPDIFAVSDILESADGKAHDYEILFHLDTTRVRKLSEYENGVISDFGRKYEIAIIPLDGEGEVELVTVSAAEEPLYQGWFNGRNEENLHEAITVSRRVKGVRNFRFNTLIIPITVGDELPRVDRSGSKVRIQLGKKDYLIDLDALNV